MSARSLRGFIKRTHTAGIAFRRLVSIRIPNRLAIAVEQQQARIKDEIGANVTASDLLRRAIETYLIEAGHDIAVTPWPSPPDLETKVKQLEAENQRPRRLLANERPDEIGSQPFFSYSAKLIRS